MNIEPLPKKYHLLKKYRKRDINIQLGASNINGNAKLHITCQHDVCSSIFHNKNINNSKYINIKILTMSKICKMYIPIGKEIHFCKIDVEKAEKNVLLGFDFIHYRPKVFCIESLIDEKTKKREYLNWDYILKENGYNFGYDFKNNRFYYDNTIKGLKDKFNKIDYYTKFYFKKFMNLKTNIIKINN